MNIDGVIQDDWASEPGVMQACLRDLRNDVGDRMVLMADLCVDEYTDHGHCGVLDGPAGDPRTSVDNDRTLEIYQRIAVAQADKTDQYYKEIITHGMPLGNDGNPVPGVLAVSPCIIPKGAKNVAGAKALLSDFIRPESLNSYLKETRARYLPVMMKNVKEDPYWTDPNDPHRPVAVQAGLIQPTLPNWMNYNPAYAQVLSEQLWSQAEAGITQKNMTVDQAVDEVAARIRAALEHIAPEHLAVSPDCGMKYLPRDRAKAKLRAMADGAAIVRAELAR